MLAPSVMTVVIAVGEEITPRAVARNGRRWTLVAQSP